MAGPSTIIDDLRTRGWALAGVAAAAQSGLLDAPERAEGPVSEAIVHLLDQLGLQDDGSPVAGLDDALSPPFGDALRAELLSDALQIRELVVRARDRHLDGVWDHTDPLLLEAQGETGRVFRFAAQMLLPGLEGLEERLSSSGARFLDVGTGVGVIAIELCGLYPSLSAVGIEPLAEAREIAERKIAEMGLIDRITVRDQLVQDVDETNAYDLAFVPSVFLGDALEPGLDRVHTALKPGGWVIALAGAGTDDPVVAAVRRLRLAFWGAAPFDADELHMVLVDHGFTDLVVAPATGAYQPVMARRSG